MCVTTNICGWDEMLYTTDINVQCKAAQQDTSAQNIVWAIKVCFSHRRRGNWF